MMTAREKFDAWILWTGLPDAEVARRLGCDASLPGKLRRDPDRRPGLEVAHAIERKTAEPRDDGRRWRHGPIRTEEWLVEQTDAA